MSKDSDSSKTQLFLGLLGFVGVVLTILAGIFTPLIQKKFDQESAQTPIVIVQSSTPAPVIPTDTTLPGEPTSTPAPTAVPPVALGADWQAGCISSLWAVYPPAELTASNGCLNLPVDTFYTTNGHLAFVYSGNVSSAEVHGIFAKLPGSNGRLSLNFNLGVVSNGEIWLGVFGAPDINANGAMLVVPATNNVDKTKILFKSMPGQSLFSQSSGPVDAAASIYDVIFTFDNGEVSAKLQSGQINLGAIPALASERWLFIGYQVFNGANQLKAEFFNLQIAQ